MSLPGLVALLGLLSLSAVAQAQNLPEPASPRAGLVLERVEIQGNRKTDARVITNALPVRIAARFFPTAEFVQTLRAELLALGYFRAVDVRLSRGRAPGYAVLHINVTERVAWTLDRLWFGRSNSSKAWLGGAVSDRNVLGTGLAAGVALLGSIAAPIEGARNQVGGRLYLARPGRMGLFGALALGRGSEPVRSSGPDGDDGVARFSAFDFTRVSAELGARVRLASEVDAGLSVRADRLTVDAERFLTATGAPSAATTNWLGLQAQLRYDDRDSATVPRAGTFVLTRLGVFFGNDATYGPIDARLDHWWPVRDGAIGLRVVAATTIGATPWFDRVYAGDIHRMLAPRAIGLPLAAQSAPRFFRDTTRPLQAGNIGGSAVLEYVAPLAWSSGHVQSAQVFLGAGLYSLGNRADWGADPAGLPMQIDLLFDGGVRLETSIGQFELSIANAWGRLPW